MFPYIGNYVRTRYNMEKKAVGLRQAFSSMPAFKAYVGESWDNFRGGLPRSIGSKLPAFGGDPLPPVNKHPATSTGTSTAGTALAGGARTARTIRPGSPPAGGPRPAVRTPTTTTTGR